MMGGDSAAEKGVCVCACVGESPLDTFLYGLFSPAEDAEEAMEVERWGEEELCRGEEVKSSEPVVEPSHSDPLRQLLVHWLCQFVVALRKIKLCTMMLNVHEL